MKSELRAIGAFALFGVVLVTLAVMFAGPGPDAVTLLPAIAHPSASAVTTID